MLKKLKKFRWASIILFFDIISKLLTHLLIPLMSDSIQKYPYGGIAIFKNFLGIEFSISHATNTGAAWGLFANSSQQLLLFRIIFLALLFLYLIFINKNLQIQYPLILIIAGAFANILDFLFYGHVIDMFHFILWGYDYPVFNIADISIFIGICWLIALSLFSKKKNA